MSFLNGKKTYLVAALGVLWAVVGLWLKWLTPQEAVEALGFALGLAGLRHGVGKVA